MVWFYLLLTVGKKHFRFSSLNKNNTKMINTRKMNIHSLTTSAVKDDKEFKITMKNPKLLLKVNKILMNNFEMYGAINDQSLLKLQKYQEKYGVEVLVKSLHIPMEGKKLL